MLLKPRPLRVEPETISMSSAEPAHRLATRSKRRASRVPCQHTGQRLLCPSARSSQRRTPEAAGTSLSKRSSHWRKQCRPIFPSRIRALILPLVIYVNAIGGMSECHPGARRARSALGTNAPSLKSRPMRYPRPSRPWQLLTLSARTATALDSVIESATTSQATSRLNGRCRLHLE
jgi:hypothetical protein